MRGSPGLGACPVAADTRTSWRPPLGPGNAADISAVAREVAARLREPAHVEESLAAARRQTGYPRSVRWRPEGLWQGYAGLAVLWSAVDAAFPDEGWDAVGRDHLRLAVRAAEEQRRPTSGLSAGLAGLAAAAWSLSRNGTRYRGLLTTLDAALVELVAAETAWVLDHRPFGIEAARLDVISGLSGAGRYLLLRRADPACRAALEGVLRSLVLLTRDVDGVPRWHTPPQYLPDGRTQAAYPGGNLNCGLAHGIPGPLALLSLAATHGVVVSGQMGAIRGTAAWLHDQQIVDDWGVNWPTAVPLGPAAPPQAAATGSRAAWCYGSPGVARALWLAGAAVDESAYRDLAVSAMEAVYRRPVPARHIDSPTFCHGAAGLLQVTLRFASETALPLFVEAADALLGQVRAAYEPGSRLGYRNLEPSGGRVDQPGLLDGAAGVALVLLAASSPVEPSWDALFLLS